MKAGRLLRSGEAGWGFWHLMQSTGRAVWTATCVWATESEAVSPERSEPPKAVATGVRVGIIPRSGIWARAVPKDSAPREPHMRSGLWLENHGWRMVESKLCRSWSRHEGWLSRGCLPSAESSVWRRVGIKVALLLESPGDI